MGFISNISRGIKNSLWQHYQRERIGKKRGGALASLGLDLKVRGQSIKVKRTKSEDEVLEDEWNAVWGEGGGRKRGKISKLIRKKILVIYCPFSASMLK